MGKNFAKMFIYIGIALSIFTMPFPVRAEKEAGQSAIVSYIYRIQDNPTQNYNVQLKRLALRRVLQKHESPLLDSTEDFIATCTKYNLDCFLLPSITGLESSFGKYTWPKSHNPFGWGGGYIMFNDWAAAINAVGLGLRENYLNRGALSVDQIGPIYAESPTWALRVNHFMKEFRSEEQKLRLIVSANQVKL